MYVRIVELDGTERYFRALRGITFLRDKNERLVIHDVTDDEIELSGIYYFTVEFINFNEEDEE